MAVFFDLDDDDCSASGRSRPDTGASSHQDQLKSAVNGGPSGASNGQVLSTAPNKLAAALTCYPIALSLSSHLDLNDLHALAATCRNVHLSLAQYAHQLKSQSLRCIHDGRPVLAEVLLEQRGRTDTVDSRASTSSLQVSAISQMQATAEAIEGGWPPQHSGGLYASMGVSSKISSCARDLVAPCRRCGTVVCRNCAAKSPSTIRLKDRFRRLCKTCLDAPIEAHLQDIGSADDTSDSPPLSSASSMRSERSASSSSASGNTPGVQNYESTISSHRAFTSSAFLRGPCTCETRGVFLCTPCGQSLRVADTTYKRVWTWRSRYSTHIGDGLGTGLGLGNQAQKCGRGEDCLETSGKAVCWVEIDCSQGKAHDPAEVDRNSFNRLGTPDSAYGSNKPGYLQQEIEGIGGVVKKKVKKRVKVGAGVWEWDDERESGKYLEREAKGTARSWCGWCGRTSLVMSLPNAVHHRRRSSSLERRDPYSSPSVYYDEEAYIKTTRENALEAFKGNYPARRTSHDEHHEQHQELLVDVDRTLQDLLEREDVDKNQQITIEDNGPKHINLGTLASAGYRSAEVRGNYMISNLLQELTLAKDLGKKVVKIHRSRLSENPVDRLSRRIRDEFWNNLTRCLDGDTIERAGRDPKDWTADPRPRIYIPSGCPEQFEYYTQVAKDRPEMRLDVLYLPEGPITAEYVRGLNSAPGILALAMRKEMVDGQETLKGEPFVVPGGRFNELYGWDSYMESLGLLENGRVDLAKSMVLNFAFCVRHYGKILNANRSYYLTRSQPPFLTDMALKVYDKIKHESGALDFLRLAIRAAIKEYYNVWMATPRYDPGTGLSRYRPDGLGVPPETEASHFVHILTPYAQKHGMTFSEFVEAYNSEKVHEPELDEYFLHDRAVRESGHDTSYRLEGCAANLATIDLNSLLYKYEIDISWCIRHYFKDRLSIPAEFQTEANRKEGFETSATWDRRARLRKARIDKYMWNEAKGMYFDYDTVHKKRTTYETATTFWAMWAGCASPKQAAALVLNALPKFDCFGGLVSGTEESRGEVGLDRPNRQWDYPFGWAPQQMLAWGGFIKYGYIEEAQRLAYKWLYMVTKAFVDFNGVVVEKYNVTRELDPHKVEAEYGNQGADFKGVPREGFGWVNASYVYGLSFIPMHMKRALGTLTPYETFARATEIKLGAGEGTIEEGSDESRQESSDEAVVTSSHESP
ncbi:hypothetical protein AYL99_07719 [Fonsecaea erecta]|uniref:Trehalase n=1 Tax=Fonsecaea erecta TaxID=1367422 RepID=A0A178ZFR3_9EURO|nr:hypothetical protein AYL99_07719 [Fonsecaea erecta]OAP58629.1 hypothetical protein AYL99_07719 [Fonsecaea erecta]